MAEKEYIEREEALKICISHYRNCLMMNDFNGDSIADIIKTEIEDLPKADVAPVKRGHWIYLGEDDGHGDECEYEDKCSCIAYRCSNCKKIKRKCELTDYCPSCGAKMDKEYEND